MKESFYNYVLYDGSWGYWYNALTGFYFRLSINVSKKLQSLLHSRDVNSLRVFPSLLEKLIECGFIIEDEVNELDIIRSKHNKAVNNKQYFLVILPTLNCNYNCWYCIQEHIPTIMQSNVMEAVCNHISYMINEEHIESLHLDWFGGEPFMYFERIIKPISEYAIKLCLDKDIPFINSATTNGYFINNKISAQLSELKFSQFQITLDGERKFHDKVKYTKGCASAFDYVLRNINQLLNDNPSIRVFLRINYTHDTLTKNIVNEVSSKIELKNRERIIITPKKVWQEKSDKGFVSTLVEILDLFEINGFKVSRRDVSYTFLPCYVNQQYYNSISYNGNVIKCTACDDLYSDSPYGKLQPDGTIAWVDHYNDKCIVPTFETEQCLKCKKLPTCMGPCPRDYMLGLKRCKYDAMDEDFEKALVDYLKNEYKS